MRERESNIRGERRDFKRERRKEETRRRERKRKTK